jgi:aminoglycoside phosphotransferase (APT) family kinase protein
VPCDPGRGDEVAAATLAWIRAHVDATAAWSTPLVPADAGLSTFIWFGHLVGDALPPRYREPVALRLYGTVGDDEVLAREHGVLEFVTEHGYPAPVPLAAVPVGPENPVGLPWMVLPKVPGEPLLAVVSKAPWAAGARLRELAALQVALHDIPVAGVPLPTDRPLVDAWLADRAPEMAEIATPRAQAVFDALVTRAGIVRPEVPVTCHGDFHPLNVLSHHDDSGWHHVVIDWTDVVVGDRHFDVARTLALFGVAWMVAGSRAERVALRAAGPWLLRSYRRAYESAIPVDSWRLAYWTAAHLLRGWWQVAQLHADGFESTRASTDAIPISVADALLARAEKSLQSIG